MDELIEVGEEAVDTPPLAGFVSASVISLGLWTLIAWTVWQLGL
jgi:hypothetical protein